jgi:hypothetical protein
MDNVQKFHYLPSVTNEVHQLIPNLPVKEQNCHVAWTLLCDRYNNVHLIAATREITIVTATDQQAISHRLKSTDKSVSKQSECY